MLRAILRITFLLSLALVLPRFLLLYAPQQPVIFGQMTGYDNQAQLGLVSFNDFIKQSKLDLVSSKTLLLTNQLQDKSMHHYLQFLKVNGISPSLIYRSHYSPVTTKMKLEQFNTQPPKIVIPIIDHLTSKDLKKIDLMLVDLQNTGLAEDDALKDLIELMQLAKLNHKPIVILDRPNPLGCLQEGPLVEVLDTKLQFKLPLRYGLTLGEVASYANAQLFDNEIKLVVLSLKNYLRTNFRDFEQLQKVYTDGLFEILHNSCPAEIKTDCHNNFQCLALPEYLNFSIDKWYELRAALWHYNVDVVLCRYLEPKTDQYFVGVRLLIDDINRVSYIKVWQLFFKFMHEAGVKVRPTITLERIFGASMALELMSGNLGDETTKFWLQELHGFSRQVRPYLIYRPWPIKVL